MQLISGQTESSVRSHTLLCLPVALKALSPVLLISWCQDVIAHTGAQSDVMAVSQRWPGAAQKAEATAALRSCTGQHWQRPP